MINPEYKFALTKDKVYATRGVTKSRLVKILEVMLWGIPVKLGDYVYELVETEDGGFAPMVVINEEERLVQGMPDMSLMYFSELVSKLSDKEFDDITRDYAFSRTVTNAFMRGRH